MDTPEKTQQQTGAPHTSTFEDSPVFNYINSLSPIKPVKSVHVGQTFSSINFSSIPSVFTSPHVNMQKESRFVVRQPLSELSKAQFSSVSGDENNLCMDVLNVVRLSNCSANRAQANRKPICSINKAVVDPPEDCLTHTSPQYDCGSPNHNMTPCFGAKTNFKLVIGSTSLIEFIHDGLDERNIQTASVPGLEMEHQSIEAKQVPGCDWQNLTSEDGEDMLIFDSIHEPEPLTEMPACFADPDSNLTSLPEETICSSQEFPTDHLSFDGHQDLFCDLPLDRNREMGDGASDGTPLVLTGSDNKPPVVNLCENHADKSGTFDPSGTKVDSQNQRGLRRRCLVFEMAGAHRKNLQNSKNAASSLQRYVTLSSKIRQTTKLKDGVGLSQCMLPGVGLHLNSLATMSKDSLSKEKYSCGNNLVCLPCTINPYPLSSAQETPQTSLSVERDAASSSAVQDLQIMHDSPPDNATTDGDDQSQNSPKKKKRKAETSSESEGCKRCNCKKSKCLKLYCECFAAGVYCVEPCTCQGCFNKPIHEDTVLATRKQIESRNPLAFAPKVIRASEPLSETGVWITEEANKTPASARHKRGCNCKKSNCLKKYCECFQGGAGCSISCRCEGCRNTFGRKDGTILMEIDEPEEEKAATIFEDKDFMPDSKQSSSVLNEEGLCSENSLLITPSQMLRPSILVPFPCVGKPPLSVFSLGSSVRLNSSSFQKKETLLPDPGFDKKIIISNEDIPEILRGNDATATPIGGVKVTSPNRKRISSPRSEFGSSPSARKGCRKLILKSIPSFPSLTSETTASELPANTPGTSFNSLC